MVGKRCSLLDHVTVTLIELQWHTTGKGSLVTSGLLRPENENVLFPQKQHHISCVTFITGSL